MRQFKSELQHAVNTNAREHRFLQHKFAFSSGKCFAAYAGVLAFGVFAHDVKIDLPRQAWATIFANHGANNAGHQACWSQIDVLGPSGVGKSTLAALALKQAAPQSGHITLGGVDIASLAAPALRQRIGWLSQATHLFDATIRDNLLLARPEADDAALWSALEAARIADLVRTLPDGLDTWVGEGGARFSGGQGRRLALARALLSPAPILILDEPCAGLDAETERDFHLTLNEAAPGRTIILIAHRLTGAERLDRIYRLSAGRAVAAAG